MTQRTSPPRTLSRAAGAVAATIAVVESNQQEPPLRSVVRGDRSSDEMCLGLLTATFGSP